MTNLGIMASQISGHLGTVFDASDYESIATINLSGADSSSITFSSIPQTYKHLQFRVFARDDRAATANNVRFQFNGDTGNNYRSHSLYSDGSTVSSYNDGPTYGVITSIASNSATSGIFGGFVMDILDYSSASKNKTTRTLCGYELNGSGGIELQSGLWINTSAITQIAIRFNAASNLKQYSHLAIYGIKG
jgi:hypothetical protein